VVLKLLETVRPHTLYLGQKDAQQAALVGRMIRDLDLPVHLTVSATVRERDGLAYSSRNAYLTPEERLRARGLPRALKAARQRARQGATVRSILAEATKTLKRESKPDRIDYLAVVDPRTFEPINRLDGRGLLIAAVRIGRTRLLDNMSLSAPRS